MSWDSFFYLNCTRPHVIIHDIGYILHPSIEHFHNISISLCSLSFKSPKFYKLFCLAQAGTRRQNDVIQTSTRCRHLASTPTSCPVDVVYQGDFFFAVRPIASESICRCKGTSEGVESSPLVSCSKGILTN